MLTFIIAAQIMAAAPAKARDVEPAPFGLLAPSDMSNTLGATFTPDGKTVYFCKSEPGGTGLTVFVAHEVNGKWSAPEVAGFSGRYADADPALSPDGSVLVFSSKRPPRPDVFTLFEVFLRGPRKGEIVQLPNSANATGDQFYGSIAPSGELYFSVSTDSGYRLMVVPSLSETTSVAVPVVFAGSSKPAGDFDETVSADGRFMVFGSDRTGPGTSDLYISLHNGNKWCVPIRLPAPINMTAQMATGLSHDGRTLYFASYRTDLSLPLARPMTTEEFKKHVFGYRNYSLHTYVAEIGDLVEAARESPSC